MQKKRPTLAEMEDGIRQAKVTSARRPIYVRPEMNVIAVNCQTDIGIDDLAVLSPEQARALLVGIGQVMKVAVSNDA